MKIFNLRTEENLNHVKILASIESDHIDQKDLWFSVPIEYAKGLCQTKLDGFLVGLLYPAMYYGEDIYLEGCVSKKLIVNINNYVIPLLLSYSPSAKRINVTASETISERFDSKGVGTGFSGGIDSFCTVLDHYQNEVDAERKINSFLFLNVGSHGSSDLDAAKSKFDRRYIYLERFPKEIGLDFVPVDSNLHIFHPWGHQKTHTLTSAAGVLVMQKSYSTYYYASSGLDYKDIIDGASRYRDIDVGAYCDAMILPLLSTESLDFILDGAQYNRAEKVLHVINYEPIMRYLNVCVGEDDKHENCSVCPKCCRTLWTLDLAGRLDDFSGLFNLTKYKKRALQYASQQVLLQKVDPFARANVELAEERGVKLPNKLVAYVYYLRKIFIDGAKKLAKSFLTQSAIDLLKVSFRSSRN